MSSSTKAWPRVITAHNVERGSSTAEGSTGGSFAGHSLRSDAIAGVAAVASHDPSWISVSGTALSGLGAAVNGLNSLYGVSSQDRGPLAPTGQALSLLGQMQSLSWDITLWRGWLGWQFDDKTNFNFCLLAWAHSRIASQS